LFYWLQTLLTQHAYLIVFLVILFNNICLPLPGDTVLVVAGFLLGKGTLSIWGVIISGAIACFLGGMVSYWLGRRFGRHFIKRLSWLRITPEKIRRVEKFCEKHGAKSVFFARFVAVLHPLIGFVSGLGKTPWFPFLFFNLAGSCAYVVVFTLGGYFFGEKWEALKKALGPGFFYAFLAVAVVGALGFILRHRLRAIFLKMVPRKIVKNPKK
jgi:membrane protein DedA with SNARE-associated domain